MNAEFHRVRQWRAPILSPEGAGLARELSWRRHIATGGYWSLSLGGSSEEPEEPVTFALSIGGSPGTLTAPLALVHSLLQSVGGAAAIEDEPELVAMLLELALEPTLLQLEQRHAGLSVRLAPPRRATPRDWLPVTLACSWHGASGVLRLDLRADAATRLATAISPLARQRERLPDFLIPVTLRAFVVDLSLASVRALEPGDVVLVEGQRGEEFYVLVNERPFWRARWDEGELRVVSGRKRQSEDLEDLAVTSGDHPPDEEEGLGLDDLPVRLTFELGKVMVPLQDLESMGPGYVFELARGPDQPLDIVANGRRIGRGRIVEVSGALGVQVVWIGRHG
jgi:type III secretion protein Q